MPTVSDEAKQLIKDAIDVESLIRSLGFVVSRSTGSEVRAPCIIHGGDNVTAFSIRTDTKKWKCFTKKCEQDATGRSDNDLIALVRKVTGRNFIDSLLFLAEFSGLNMDPTTLFVQDTEEHVRRKDMRKYVSAIGKITKRKSLPKITEEQVLLFSLSRDDYFLEKGFSESTLEIFEVGSMVDRYGVPRAAIPIRDAVGKLVGASARRTDSDDDPRYLIEFEFQKGQIMYNQHQAVLTGSETVIIVEGFKALWAVWEAGIKNVVACMGANMSREQVLSLCSSPFRNCVIMLDGDEAGRSGTISVNKKLEPFFNIQILSLPEKTSPDDYDRLELKELLDLYLQAF